MKTQKQRTKPRDGKAAKNVLNFPLDYHALRRLDEQVTRRHRYCSEGNCTSTTDTPLLIESLHASYLRPHNCSAHNDEGLFDAYTYDEQEEDKHMDWLDDEYDEYNDYDEQDEYDEYDNMFDEDNDNDDE